MNIISLWLILKEEINQDRQKIVDNVINSCNALTVETNINVYQPEFKKLKS